MMKIPKTAAKWMAIGCGAGFLLGPLLSVYFQNKRQEVLDNSPTYAGAVDINQKLPLYEKELARCAPRNKLSPVLEEKLDTCVEKANKYDDLIAKLQNLINDPEYIATRNKADVLMSHAAYSNMLSFLVVIPLAIGIFAYTGRKDEEFAEKNLEYIKKLEELNKTVNR